MPQLLTPKLVAETCLANWSRLAAVAAPSFNRCCYDYGDSTRCAIGIALTDCTLSKIHECGLNVVSVCELISKSIIEVPSIDDVDLLSLIQHMHDMLVGSRRSLLEYFDLVELPQEFKAWLQPRLNSEFTPTLFREFLELVIAHG